MLVFFYLKSLRKDLKNIFKVSKQKTKLLNTEVLRKMDGEK